MVNPLNPLNLQLASLAKARDDLREHNQFEHDDIRPDEPAGDPPPDVERARTADGSYNDVGCPMMGAKGSGFGRNGPLAKTVVDRKRLLTPDPRVISNTLIARDTFKPAGGCGRRRRCSGGCRSRTIGGSAARRRRPAPSC